MFRWLTALLLTTALAVTGCGKADDDTLTLQLNWKPEPQFGGFYAADYAKHGLKVNVQPGGASAPTVELLASGKVPFAVVSADEIPKARQVGAKIVGLFAVYQKHPQGIMTSSKRGLKSLEDVFKTPGVVSMEAALPYATFLKNKYGFDKVKVVGADGGGVAFVQSGENHATQCFVTSEPIAAKKAGLDVTTFLVADSGFNPYATVLATSDEFAKSHPEIVKQMTAAVKEGWEAYLANPSVTNEAMQKLNPTMDLATFAASAEAQHELIATPETKELGVGTMTDERWASLIQQLKDLKVITADIKPEECYLKTK